MKAIIKGNITKYYSYRTAQVYSLFYIQDDNLFNQVKRYVEKQGHTMGNHITFTTDNGMAYQYSDHTLLIGTEVVEGVW